MSMGLTCVIGLAASQLLLKWWVFHLTAMSPFILSDDSRCYSLGLSCSGRLRQLPSLVLPFMQTMCTY